MTENNKNNLEENLQKAGKSESSNISSKQIQDDSKFEDINDENFYGDDVTDKETYSKNNETNSPMEKNNKFDSKKKLFIGISAAIASLFIILFFVFNSAKKIELKEYIEISFEGANGYGQAVANINHQKLFEKISENSRGKISNPDDILSGLTEYANIGLAIDSINAQINNNEKLSNGDEISVDVTYNENLLKDEKIKFVPATIKAKVEGLPDVKSVNPFESFEVTFSGIAPLGEVSFEYRGENNYIDTYSFTADKTSNLKNGDVITFKVNSEESQTIDHGFILTPKEKKYTVEGLQEYITKFEDIPSESIEKLKKEALDKVAAFKAKSDDTISYGETEYMGYVFNNLKENKELDVYNSLNILYKTSVSEKNNKFPPTEIYFPVQFNNISSGENGLTYNPETYIVGSYYKGNYGFAGYDNPYKMYSDLLTGLSEYFSGVAGDGFEEYSTDIKITKIDDLSKEFKEKMKQESLDLIKSYTSSYDYYGSTIDSSNIKFYGEYLLKSKDLNSNKENSNKYYQVYSSDVYVKPSSHLNEDNFNTKLYFVVGYEGIIKLPKDKYLITDHLNLAGSVRLGKRNRIDVKGFEDINKLHDEIVNAQRDLFTFEASGELKKLD